MKITIVLLVVLTSLLGAINVSSQSVKISLNLKNSTVEQVLNEIENKSDYYFLFNQKLVDVNRKVDMVVEDRTIHEILAIIFANQDVDYLIVDRQIILAPKENLKSIGEFQHRIVMGKVMDAATGEPLPGVNINIGGQANGTVTDLNGMYSVSVRSANDVLLFSFIGYLTGKVVVQDKNNINVFLTPDVKKLEEIVVVGYGTMSKRSLSAAVSQIIPDQKQMSAKVSILQSMMGKGAGLDIFQNNAQPGGSQTLQLRGKTPLYVIDGIPYSASDEPDNASDIKFNSVRRGPLNGINPNDIESIEVLKDAGAAIYGINASGGVILITTKKGKAGKVNVSYNGSRSVLKNTRYIEPMPAGEFMETANIFTKENYLYKNNMKPYGTAAPLGFVAPYTQTQIDTTVNTNWLDQVFRTGFIDNHNLSINGGGENTRVYMSVNYFKQTGTVYNSGLEKYASRLNIDQNLSKCFKLSANLSFSRIDYQNSTAGEQTSGGEQYYGMIQAALRYLPTLPIRQSNGDYSQFKNTANPVALREVDDYTISNRFLGQTSMDVTIVPEVFTAKINVGANTDVSKRDFFLPKSVFWDDVYMSRGSITDQKKFQTTIEGYFTFIKTIGGAVKVNVMAGMGEYRDVTYYSTMSFRNFNDAFETNNASSGEMNSMSSNKWKEKRRSYFSRANFDILDKYIVTATFRADAVDKFFPGNKYGYFPGVSVAWKMKSEGFLKNVSWVSDLKLRLSFGITGRNTIGSSAYASYGTSTRNQIVDFNNGGTTISPFYLSGLNYPGLKWEKTKMWNGGIDFAFGDSRFSGSIDTYLRDITDLLQTATAAPLAYYNSFPVNGGAYRGNGIELNINGQLIKTKDVLWEMNFNISHNHEYWKERYSGTTLAQYEGTNDPVRAWYYFETKGILQIGQEIPASQPAKASFPGCPVFVDQNNDHVIDYKDIKMRDTDPKVYLGLTTALTYKNLDLTVSFYGQLGHYKVVPQYDWVNAKNVINGLSNGITQLRKEVWYSGNTGGSLPGLNYDETTLGLPVNTDITYSKAGFVRCQNITLGYTFSTAQIKRWVKDLRLYMDIQNVFVITKYRGFDPEVDSYTTTLLTGRAPGSYPNARAYSVGVNINF
jgi:TonB-linked SusC/RagA family outer membrane protein